MIAQSISRVPVFELLQFRRIPFLYEHVTFDSTFESPVFNVIAANQQIYGSS